MKKHMIEWIYYLQHFQSICSTNTFFLFFKNTDSITYCFEYHQRTVNKKHKARVWTMISRDIIESIECAAPHECQNKIESSKTCIYCEIDYHFISKWPVLLECQHHICLECVEKAEGMKCKKCNDQIKVILTKNRITELMIESNLKDFYGDLKSKFSQAHVAYTSKATS